MIRSLLTMVARSLLEVGIVLLLASFLLLFFSYRLIRRATVGGGDTLESYSTPLMHLAAAVAELGSVRRSRT